MVQKILNNNLTKKSWHVHLNRFKCSPEPNAEFVKSCDKWTNSVRWQQEPASSRLHIHSSMWAFLQMNGQSYQNTTEMTTVQHYYMAVACLKGRKQLQAYPWFFLLQCQSKKLPHITSQMLSWSVQLGSLPSSVLHWQRIALTTTVSEQQGTWKMMTVKGI